MSKSRLVYIALIPLIIILSFGCVSQKDYDAIVKERDEVKAQVASLQTDLAKSKSSAEELKAKITSLQLKLMNEIIALEIYSSYVKSINESFELPKWIGWVIAGQGSLLGIYTSNMPMSKQSGIKFASDFGNALRILDNPDINKLWDDFDQSTFRGDSTTFQVTFGKLLASLTKLISDDAKALEAAIR